MENINVVSMVGRLVKDAERRTWEGSKNVKFSMRIAVNKSVKENGEWTEKANFFDVEAWNMDYLKDSLKKGKLIALSGRLDTSSYTKNDVTVTRIFIVADKLQCLTPPTATEKDDNIQSPPSDFQTSNKAQPNDFDDDDFPPF
jgi:single-strand DNA-binding protein